jgi:putative phage-type endonuclease
MSEIIQGSPEWHALRLGKATASRVADITTRTKTGYGASRLNYMAELITERLTRVPTDGFTTAAMQWGKDHEEEARAAYEFRSDCSVQLVAFIDHPVIDMAGCSPDGLIAEHGLVEFKCPNTATHIATLLGERVPSRYEPQMQFQMACTGRSYCDFVSYDPRVPERMRLFICRLRRDVVVIADLEKEVEKFLGETAAKVKLLELRYGALEAA